MYQLFCDSNCELWHTEAKALGLRVIRMPYVLDGEEFYYDLGENTDFKHFYDRMRAGAVPTTSAINEQNYIDYFEPVLREGQDIYYITFSHKLSATFESMDRAVAALKEKYPDREIRTFDTKSISLGRGLSGAPRRRKVQRGRHDGRAGRLFGRGARAHRRVLRGRRSGVSEAGRAHFRAHGCVRENARD